MNNLFFYLIVFLCFVLKGQAQDVDNVNQNINFKSASLIISCEEEVTEYKFISIEELNDEADQIIKELDISSQNLKSTMCEVRIEIRIEVTTESSKGVLSGEIITGCTNIAGARKKLKAMLLAVTKG